MKKRKQTKNKPEENKGIWASLYEKMLNNCEFSITHDIPTNVQPITAEQLLRNTESFITKLFDAGTKK